MLLRGRLGFSWCSDSSECVHGDAACLASPDCGPAAPAGPSGSREAGKKGHDCLGDSFEDAPILKRAQAGGEDSSASNSAAQNIVPGRMRVFGSIKAEDTEIPDTWEELETSSVSTEVWVFGVALPRRSGGKKRPSLQAPSSEEDSRARSRLHKDLQNLNKASRLQRHDMGRKRHCQHLHQSKCALELSACVHTRVCERFLVSVASACRPSSAPT